MVNTTLRTAALDTQLPNLPSTTLDPALHDELVAVYAAIQLLQIELARNGRFIARANATLVAGQYVAISLVSGEAKLILADASVNTKQAVGFVVVGGAVDSWCTIAISGNNALRTGLTVGSQYYLSDATPGSIVAVKPVGAGKIVQPVGFALSATELITNIASNWTQL